MEILEGIMAFIKDIIIDWRIGIVGFAGFLINYIINKDINSLIGIAITFSMFIVDIINKNYKSWYKKIINYKLQKNYQIQNINKIFIEIVPMKRKRY